MEVINADFVAALSSITPIVNVKYRARYEQLTRALIVFLNFWINSGFMVLRQKWM